MKEWIKEQRRVLGLTQEQFAQQLGLSVSAIQNWEQDRTNPLAPTIATINRMVAEKVGKQ